MTFGSVTPVPDSIPYKTLHLDVLELPGIKPVQTKALFPLWWGKLSLRLGSPALQVAINHPGSGSDPGNCHP